MTIFVVQYIVVSKGEDVLITKVKNLLFSLLAYILASCLCVLSVGCSIIPEDMNPTLSVKTTQGVPPDPVIVPGALLITEIMSRNTATLQTSDGLTPDWIELYNSGSQPIDLTGYQLSDLVRKPNKWTFPSVVLEPGEYLIVFCSGLEPTPEMIDAGEIHANFRLNNQGEDLILTSHIGEVLAMITIPPLPPDISFGLAPDSRSPLDQYLFFGEATPGEPNGTDGKLSAQEAIIRPKYDLIVNEYMTRNRSWPDAEGNLPDWVEILNTGNEDVNLLGFRLSDNPDRPDKWKFPDVTIRAGELLVVWLSGRETVYDPAVPMSLQAPFKLGRNDTHLLLTDPNGHTVFKQPLEYLPDNISLGRSPDDLETWLYFPMATPGSANTTAGFAEISGAMTLKNRNIWINEVMALDAKISTKGKTSQADWIELYNGSDQPINLLGYGLSDQNSNPFLMTLGDITLDPGQFLVVEPTSFGISTGGETLYLTGPDRRLIDRFETGLLINGVSCGRGNSGGEEPADTRFYYPQPTPGSANSTQPKLAYALAPTIEVTQVADGSPSDSIYFDQPVLVTIKNPHPDASIHYTLDGSQPTSASPLYSEPLFIDSTTVIRCRAERPDYLPSRDVTRFLLTGVRHDLPVVSINVNPSDFTGPSGVWTDYNRDHEAPITFAFHEADGTQGISFMAGVALHGSFSRKELQKSLEIKLRAAYGDRQVIYPFFPGNDVSTFKRLVLRTSGQDWRVSKLRDAFVAAVVRGELAADYMDWRHCVLYVNGEYYGLYELREKVDAFYAAAHHGADPDNLDIIKGDSIVLAGDKAEYRALLAYAKNHDLRDAEPYQQVLSQIDEDSLIDWIIAESFFGNLDSGNKKVWRERTEGGEWRWILFDLDWILYPDTYKINALQSDLLHPSGHGWQRYFSTTLQVGLMKNPAFKERFVRRYAELMNTIFTTDRMLGILDEMTEQIRGEMPRQIARWGRPTSVQNWEKNVAVLRRITGEKRGVMQGFLQNTFNLSTEQMRELFPGEFE